MKDEWLMEIRKRLRFSFKHIRPYQLKQKIKNGIKSEIGKLLLKILFYLKKMRKNRFLFNLSKGSKGSIENLKHKKDF